VCYLDYAPAETECSCERGQWCDPRYTSVSLPNAMDTA